MSNINNGGLNGKAGGLNGNKSSYLFMGDEKLTASFLIIIGSLINFFMNMKRQNYREHESFVILLIFITISIILSRL